MGETRAGGVEAQAELLVRRRRRLGLPVRARERGLHPRVVVGLRREPGADVGGLVVGAELSERLEQIGGDRERARLVDALTLAVGVHEPQMIRSRGRVAREQGGDAERAVGLQDLPRVVAALRRRQRGRRPLARRLVVTAADGQQRAAPLVRRA